MNIARGILRHFWPSVLVRKVFGAVRKVYLRGGTFSHIFKYNLLAQ